MTIAMVMIFLGIWFLLAQDPVAKQNILILFVLAWIGNVILWIL